MSFINAVITPKKIPKSNGEENITLFDRHRTIRGKFFWGIDWLTLGFNASTGIVLNKEYNLEWYSNILKNPILYDTLNIEKFLTEEFASLDLRRGGSVTIAGDNVLLLYPEPHTNSMKKALFLNYKTGVKLKISNIIPLHFDSSRFIAQKQDRGEIVSYDCQGKLEFSTQEHVRNFTAIASYTTPYLNCADIDISQNSIGISAYSVTVPENVVVPRWVKKYDI